MTLEASKTRPLGGWLLCRALKPKLERRSGLVIPGNIEDDHVVSEGVAEILSAGPGDLSKTGTRISHGLEPGNKILYRGFLRFAHQLGDLYGEDKGHRIFLLKADDVLAVLEGSGTFGFYGEYVLEG